MPRSPAREITLSGGSTLGRRSRETVTELACQRDVSFLLQRRPALWNLISNAI
jgi:hypothetical protein